VGLRSGSRVAKERAFNLETWTQQGLRYIVFGDAAPEDLRNLVTLLKGVAGS
jgi:hypothetical protein